MDPLSRAVISKLPEHALKQHWAFYFYQPCHSVVPAKFQQRFFYAWSVEVIDQARLRRGPLQCIQSGCRYNGEWHLSSLREPKIRNPMIREPIRWKTNNTGTKHLGTHLTETNGNQRKLTGTNRNQQEPMANSYIGSLQRITLGNE